MSKSPSLAEASTTTDESAVGAENQPPKASEANRINKPDVALKRLAMNQTKNASTNEAVACPTTSKNDETIETVSCIGEYDVLFGQGPKQRHVNKEFRRLMEANLTPGLKKEKSVIVQSIIKAIKSKRGKFLKKVPDSNECVVLVNDDEISKKVLGALKQFNRKPREKSQSFTPPVRDETAPKSVAVRSATNSVASDTLCVPSAKAKAMCTVDVSGGPSAKAKALCAVDVSSGHVSDSLGIAGSSLMNVAQQSSCLPKQKTKRLAANISFSEGDAKRLKKDPLCQDDALKHRAHSGTEHSTEMSLPKQLDGVRVSVTKKGSFEARYKAKGQGKKVFPKYIASVPDRFTAILIGNVVAKLLKENPTMTFAAAKKEALRRYKRPEEYDEDAPSTLPNNLVQQIVDELIQEDNHPYATRVMFAPEQAENVVNL